MTTKSPDEKSLAVRLNRWMLSLSKNWIAPLLFVIGLYALLPVFAPVAMRLGWTGLGNGLYNVYSPMCHQFAYRSWFLFGEQPAYPRESARIAGLNPYENYLGAVKATVNPPITPPAGMEFEIDAKYFVGNDQMGYKTAICQRDVAIYLALFAGGLIFAIPAVRRHLRPVPWWLYVLLGLGPIGIDGFSQLLSYPLPPFWTEGLWPVRETSPFFRTLTGALFGLMNAWLAFPYLEQSSHEVVNEISGKFDRRRQREANETAASK